MIIDEVSIKRIKNVLCVAEQGQQTIPYGKVEVMADGPNGVRQITLSIGFTQYGSNLGKVIETYVNNIDSIYKEELAYYISRLRNTNTVDSSEFKSLLKKAGEEDPIMAQVQEDMFIKLYLEPAMKWGEREGFIEPFSYLIICDSFLHSGSILANLRNKFSEKTPAHGGNEESWIRQYLDVRHNWLANHTNRLIRNSSYRTKYYKELLALGDWQLDEIHTIALNGVKPLLV